MGWRGRISAKPKIEGAARHELSSAFYEQADRLLAGCLDAPFDILGPHKLGAHKDGETVRLTVFMPAVDGVAVDGGEALAPVPDRPGLFTGTTTKKDYRLRLSHQGHEWVIDDPYRFPSPIGDVDLYLFGEGNHKKLWTVLGAHIHAVEGVDGIHFAVWAPNAMRVSVVGGFNGWNGLTHPMRRLGGSGMWDIFIPGLDEGEAYKFEIMDRHGTVLPQKADPYGFGAEHPPATASIARNLDGHDWGDQDWLSRRGALQRIDQPISIYEVHLGSWARVVEDNNRRLSYLELAQRLVPYAKDMGFTHIELMPISEFPFDGSWGYQPIGLYAPTIRYGTLSEFRHFVDTAHRAGLGILLDWVPGHFPEDSHGLGRFDGTALYEHEDRKEGFHPDWNTLIYNYGRPEVANMLTANALYWLEEHHVDGLRVDAVASMLYRDYSRAEGEWVPNIHGGRENLEAIAFLKKANELAYGADDGIMMVAEESTAFPGVSRPTDQGGLGFGFKWNMGWMNDTLSYMEEDPINRKYHHHKMTFGLHYAFSENFILPISHDEVVHGKKALVAKMPGNKGEQLANLRAYYGFMWGHPGKKLLFMGCEFAQEREWNHDASLDWHLLDDPAHKGVQSLVRDLNNAYRHHPALHQLDCKAQGFQWVVGDADAQSCFAFLRFGQDSAPPVLVISNMTPVERGPWQVGVPCGGDWREIINTDAHAYGGSNRGNTGRVSAQRESTHGFDHALTLTLPPLTTLFLTPA
ncbi:MAG: 1,4-alpha-glucan branching protein GlgB [Pseudomonadota bacterium]